MIVKEDLGELVFGGAVTAAEWWDGKRISEGKLAKTEILKKAGFYTYLLIGGISTLASAFGWFRRYDAWTTRMAHGFIYDLPRFGLNTVQAMSKKSTGSSAVAEAQSILNARRAAAALPAGRSTGRTYEPEFSKVGVI